MFYARLRVNGKQKWKTLNTKTLTVAKLRLADMERAMRSMINPKFDYLVPLSPNAAKLKSHPTYLFNTDTGTLAPC